VSDCGQNIGEEGQGGGRETDRERDGEVGGGKYEGVKGLQVPSVWTAYGAPVLSVIQRFACCEKVRICII
jgi:hypothetical protein